MSRPTAKLRRRQILGAIVAITLASGPSPGFSASFTSLSSHFVGDMQSSSAWAISGDGSTVTGWVEVITGYIAIDPFPPVPVYGQQGYRWQVGSNAELLPSVMTNGADVSHDGSVVVGNNYRWTQPTGPQDLGALASTPSARGVSGDGATVVGTAGIDAFRWTALGGIETLGYLPAANPTSFATGVSGDGTVIVGGGHGGAWRWTEATGMQPLATVGPLNETFLGQPNGISADASTVVGQGTAGGAWRWDAVSGVQYFGIPSQAAYAASADGSVIVGGDQWLPSNGIAFIWDETNGVRRLDTVLTDAGLDVSGWNLHAALGISDDGTKIVGKGTNPFGVTEAWYADLTAVPVPPSIYLVGSGLVGLIRFRRRSEGA